VVADLVGLEDDASLEDRRERMVADLDVLVPQLDIPAPFRTPVLVEVDQDVEPAVELSVFYVVEVDIDVDVASGAG
jgi:hypothetical protein